MMCCRWRLLAEAVELSSRAWIEMSCLKTEFEEEENLGLSVAIWAEHELLDGKAFPATKRQNNVVRTSS